MPNSWAFRAWHLPNKKMIPWEILSRLMAGADVWLPHTIERARLRSEQVPDVTILRHGNPFTNPDLVMMQWTGLFDAGGRPIYAADIIESEIHNPNRFAIAFLEGGFCATHPKLAGYLTDINHFGADGLHLRVKIVGNTFQNPEAI